MLNVFTYWEHAPKSRRWPYIEFCLDTIRSKCLDGCLFHHVTSANIDKYISDGILHPSWKNIKELGVKSDCVRAACLMLYGGLTSTLIRSCFGLRKNSTQVTNAAS